MRVVSLIFLLVLLISASCKHDKAIEENIPVQKIIYPDSIYFEDLNPDTTIRSIDSLFFVGAFGCSAVPYSPNLTKVYHISIDGDTAADFAFTVTTFYQFISASNPCNNYNYEIFVGAVHAGDSIAVITQGTFFKADKLMLNDTVSGELKFKAHGYLRRDVTQLPIYYDFSNGQYLGFRHTINNKPHYGWIHLATDNSVNGVIIKDWALNLTPENDIFCGQTQ